MSNNVTKFITLSALLIAMSGLARAETIGYWRFNEKAPGQQADGTPDAIIDSSGNGHHGTAVGDPLPSYVDGMNDPPSAIYLTSRAGAVEDNVTVPHSEDFNLMLADLQDYTIEAIVKISPVQLGKGPTIVSKASDATTWALRTMGTGEFSLYLQGTVLPKTIYNFTYPDIHGTSNIMDDEWHHLAAVVDANADPLLTSVTLYVDHVMETTAYITDHLYYDATGKGNPDWFNENLGSDGNLLIGDFYLGREPDQLVGAFDAVRFSTGILAPEDFLTIVPEPASIGLLLALFASLAVIRFSWPRRR